MSTQQSEPLRVEELRIGNWIQRVALGSNITFDGIKHISFQVASIAMDGAITDFLLSNKVTFYPDEKLSGIPLTPEWLERMGFEKDGNTYVIKFGNNEEIELDRDGDHFNVFYNQYNTDNTQEKILMNLELEYVHSLQNLIFALTNQELEIKEHGPRG